MLMPPWRLSGKESAWQCRRHGFDLWVRKSPWRRKWQPTSEFLPGKSHGLKSMKSQGSRVDYSPWGHKRIGHNLAAKQEQQRILLNNKRRIRNEVSIMVALVILFFFPCWLTTNQTFIAKKPHKNLCTAFQDSWDIHSSVCMKVGRFDWRGDCREKGVG